MYRRNRHSSPVPPSAAGFGRRWPLIAVVAVAGLLLAGIAAIAYISEDAAQGNGFTAKTWCSLHYLAGRAGDDILQHELNRPEASAFAVYKHEDAPAVTSHLPLPFADTALGHAWGLAATAVYRPGLGCTLARDIEPGELLADLADSPRPGAKPPFQLMPLELRSRTNRDVDQYIASEFKRGKGTRALLVWHRNRLVGERYAPGYSASSPLVSWSMAKSVTHAVLGIAVQQGLMSTEDRNLLPHWSEDSRADIRVEDLVRMQSGLAFDETYTIGGDAVKMLYATHSIADFASQMPAIHPPGAHWSYSSGTSNILARVIANQVRSQLRMSLAQFAYRYLFQPIGAESFVMEQDAAGNLLGSSYVWATARDWLQFGRLYLENGSWQGQRMLPENWSEHAALPAEHSNGQYGGHFWINGLNAEGQRIMPNLPEDLYYASGFEGQDVIIVPSMDLVVVRLGLTPTESDWNLNTHLAPLIEVLRRF